MPDDDATDERWMGQCLADGRLLAWRAAVARTFLLASMLLGCRQQTSGNDAAVRPEVGQDEAVDTQVVVAAGPGAAEVAGPLFVEFPRFADASLPKASMDSGHGWDALDGHGAVDGAASLDLPNFDLAADRWQGLVCTIDAQTYEQGARDPQSNCRSCQPLVSATSWVVAADGTVCGNGQICNAGACVAGCLIDRHFYAPGAISSTDDCKQCQPSVLTSAWSNQNDGAPCLTTGVCQSGRCMDGCWIDGDYHGLGERSSTKACRACQPAKSRKDWTPLPSSQCSPISAAGKHSCAISQGDVWCWGDNTWGQLGDGTTTASTVPVKVQGLAGPAWSVSAGSFDGDAGTGGASTCALLRSGAVQCWGSNRAGTLGTGMDHTTLPISKAPLAVSGLASGVGSLSIGGDFACVTKDNGIWCWGDNTYGTLGIGSAGEAEIDQPKKAIVPAGGIGSVAAGRYATCARVIDSVYCWGSNQAGEFGNGSYSSTAVGQPAMTLPIGSGVTLLAKAKNAMHTCAITNGTATCWGANDNGQVGSDDSTATVGCGAGCTRQVVLSPKPVSGLPSSPRDIVAGRLDSCAVVDQGVWCWGDNSRGQLGSTLGTRNVAPRRIEGLSTGVEFVSIGDYHVCAIASGAVMCWGANDAGQLGNQSTTDAMSPAQTVGLGTGL